MTPAGQRWGQCPECKRDEVINLAPFGMCLACWWPRHKKACEMNQQKWDTYVDKITPNEATE